MLRLGTRNQYIAIYEELAAKELLAVRDVLSGFAPQAFIQVTAIVYPGAFRKLVLAMRI